MSERLVRVERFEELIDAEHARDVAALKEELDREIATRTDAHQAEQLECLLAEEARDALREALAATKDSFQSTFDLGMAIDDDRRELRGALARARLALERLCYRDAGRTMCCNCGLPVGECERYPGGCAPYIAGRLALRPPTPIATPGTESPPNWECPSCGTVTERGSYCTGCKGATGGAPTEEEA